LTAPRGHATTTIPSRAGYVRQITLKPKWLTTAEVAVILGYGLTKTKMLIITGDLKSLKDGGSRRILPEWVDEYVAGRVADAEEAA
jgi:excisionase family DNA binding protein